MVFLMAVRPPIVECFSNLAVKKKGFFMSTLLLEMTPRVAGANEVEPAVEFESRWESESADCPLTTNLGYSLTCD